MPEKAYKKRVLDSVVSVITKLPQVLAVWEGGSAANKVSDQYSDLDICIVAQKAAAEIFASIEAELGLISEITHMWRITKSAWGDGLVQRIYVLKDAPKHFFVDVAVFDHGDKKMIADFLEVERHGNPVVHFDPQGLIQSGNVDKVALSERQRLRVEELKQAFPIYKTLVLKEIDRGNAIDAFGFYQNGLIKPLIEILGIIHRPLQYDFGFRYVHRSFPAENQKLIESLCYVSNLADLNAKVLRATEAFEEALAQLKRP